jgi:inner membrane protein
LWPFSDARIAWDTISIIDPLFTLPLLVLLLLAAIKKRRLFNVLAVVWLCSYLGLGFVQRDRAIAIGAELAAARGHTPEYISAKPSFANLVVWKILYQVDGRFYVDAVKPTFGKPMIWEGTSIKKLVVETDLPWLDEGSQQAKDLALFRHFSEGFVALDPQVKHRVIDMRYSMLPNDINALWGIDLMPNAKVNDHSQWAVIRNERRSALNQLWAMLWE